MAHPHDTWRSWLRSLPAGGWLQVAFGPGEALRDMLKRIDGPGPALAEVRDFTLPAAATPQADVRARYYTPYAAGPAPAGALVYFHGGGFVAGDLETHDSLCRRLAAQARIRVIAIAYRLAPQHRFPAALQDALAAFDWIRGAGAPLLGVDPTRIAVGGDSAGGNLAAVVAQSRRTTTHDKGQGPAFQLLLYPLLQLVETNIKRLKALEGHVFSHAVLEQVRAVYLPTNADIDAADPRISPLLQEDLSRLAPAYVVTAGLDPLHMEGRAYADRLAAAGVAVTHKHYAQAPHGFMQATAMLQTARDAVGDAADGLAAALAEGARRNT